MITVQGSMVTVLAAACERLKSWKHIDCGGYLVRHGTVQIYDMGDHFNVLFLRAPPHRFDDSIGISVSKRVVLVP